MTLSAAYFAEVYADSTDPWGFADRWYEHRKRALTLALLCDERYASVFEPGCSNGFLTRDLAARSDQLLAMDLAPAAVAEARARCSDLPHVQVVEGDALHDWPDQRFDLVVLSEVVYYFSLSDAKAVAAQAMATAGTVVAVHWRHPVEDYPIGGDEAHKELERAAEAAGMTRLLLHLDKDVVAGVWSRDASSVAERTGLT